MATVDTEGLDPTLREKVFSLIAASHGRLYLTSGYRSDAQQAALYAQAVQKYGEADAGNWVAPPGESNHNKGLAVDVGGDMNVLAQLAPQFGLVRPMSWEPWHVEMVGTRSTSSPTAYTTPPAGQTNPVDNHMLGSSPEFIAASLSDALGSGGAVSGLGAVGSSVKGASNTVGTVGETSTTQAAAQSAQTGAGTTQTGAPTTAMPNLRYSAGVSTGGDQRLGGTHTIAQWATDVLDGLGAPVTADNLSFMERWANTESGGYNPNDPGGKYNPLNTTEGALGFVGQGGSQGDIKDFGTYQQGVAAQVYNLLHTQGAGYENILAALRKGNDPQGAAQAVDASKFGTRL